MFTLITGIEQYEKHSVICTGVVGLVLPATYEGLLEDKITITSTDVWWYLPHGIYMEKATDIFGR